jgi:4-amino-4-deoxy-L-arabinose transferase-like glycosyltransferase
MPNGVAARNGGRWGVAALVAILLLGAGLRVGEAWDGRAPVFDAAAYAAIAKNLDQGNGFTVGAGATQPSSDYSPGLPLFVAGIYKVTGGVHERLARVVLALIGTLAILFTYLLARRLAAASLFRNRPSVLCNPEGDKGQRVDRRGVAAGLIAALVVAIYPATVEYTGMLMTEPAAATLLAGAILGMLWAADGTTLWRWLVPGLTLGALALVRPEYLAIGFVLALLVLLRERLTFDWRRALFSAAIVLAGIIVVVAPWTIRNAIALDRFVTVSTGGGQVLYAGTYLPSDGNPEKVGAAVVAENPELFGPHAIENLRLEQILARLAEARHPGMEPDQALSKMGKEQLRDDVTHHFGEYAEFVATKIGRIWSHGPRAIMRTPVWEALHWVLLGLGLLGLGLLAYFRRWEALLIGTVFLAVTLISALLVASPRRVLVLIPLLSACAGAAVAWLATAARRGDDQSVL